MGLYSVANRHRMPPCRASRSFAVRFARIGPCTGSEGRLTDRLAFRRRPDEMTLDAPAHLSASLAFCPSADPGLSFHRTCSVVTAPYERLDTIREPVPLLLDPADWHTPDYQHRTADPCRRPYARLDELHANDARSRVTHVGRRRWTVWGCLARLVSCTFDRKRPCTGIVTAGAGPERDEPIEALYLRGEGCGLPPASAVTPIAATRRRGICSGPATRIRHPEPASVVLAVRLSLQLGDSSAAGVLSTGTCRRSVIANLRLTES